VKALSEFDLFVAAGAGGLTFALGAGVIVRVEVVTARIYGRAQLSLAKHPSPHGNGGARDETLAAQGAQWR